MRSAAARKKRREGREPQGGRGAKRRVLVVGLTGGIASGKSTIAAMLQELGAVVLDADRTARAVVRPGEPALAEVVRHFGTKVLAADGTLDRARLGEEIFGREPEREAINAILHPRIGAGLKREIASVDATATGPTVVVVEAAVLLEAQWELKVDTVVGVLAEQSIARGRLMQRSGLDEARAAARLRSQVPSETLRARCDHLLDTAVPLEETRQQVASLWQALQRQAVEKFGGER